jgi:hypothetical protein
MHLCADTEEESKKTMVSLGEKTKAAASFGGSSCKFTLSKTGQEQEQQRHSRH